MKLDAASCPFANLVAKYFRSKAPCKQEHHCVCDVHSNLNQDLGDQNFPQNQPAKTSCLSLTVLLNFLTVLLDIGNIVHQQT